MAAERCIEYSAFAPDHVRHGIVDQQRPEHHKKRHRAELHPLGERAGDQRWRDDGEHQLVDHESLLRDSGCIVSIGLRSDTAKEDIMETPDETVAWPERQTVPD